MAIEVIKFKEHVKGALLGFADVYSDKTDMEYYGVAMFAKGNNRWIAFAGQEYVDEATGEKKRLQSCRFRNRKFQDAFAAQVFAAVEAWRESHLAQPQNAPLEPDPSDDLPW